MAGVDETDSFILASNGCVVLLKDGNEGFDELVALCVDLFTCLCHHDFECFKRLLFIVVGYMSSLADSAKECVSLQKCFVVPCKDGKVGGVALCNDAVDEFSTSVASAKNKGAVVGGNNDERK